MRYTGPKNRLARREGVDLGLKTTGSKSHARLLKKLAVIPGQHGASRKRSKKTDYGMQLREKQKIKRMYGVTERQMKKYFKKAMRRLGNTADFLVRYLETRLDVVVYRLGFAPTCAAARQLVSHGHMSVNKKKVSISSYEVSVGDEIGFVRETSAQIPYIIQSIERKDYILPDYLKKTNKTGTLVSYPTKEHMQDTVNLQLVIEALSR